MNPSLVRVELERVLSSPKFRKSQSHCEFLRYVVEKRLENASIQETEIGVRVYGRSPDYDPGEDVIVQVEASQIRARLRKYYEDLGSSQSLRFELPEGTFSPMILTEEMAAPNRDQGIWFWTGILVAVLGVLILAGVAWRTLN